MSILDDAIREHLELKRRHGAGSDDLERLEKEAFGPPTRPGDPDFAEGEAAAESGDDGGAGQLVAGAESEATSPTEPSSGGTADWLVGEEETTVSPRAEPEAASPASTEQARAEHPQLGDTADHPVIGSDAAAEAPSGVEPSPAAPASAAEPPPIEEPPPLSEPLPPSEATPPPGPVVEPPEAPESSIFDADEVDFGDLDEEDDGTVSPQPSGSEPSPFITDEEDLSLGRDDEVSLAGETAPSPHREEVTRDRKVEEDTGTPPLPVPPQEGDRAGDPDEGEPPEPGAEHAGEDLLEETPDFLRDTPEGDRAWFEQDPPKDFDFDD